jgi:hypothetical protein
MATPARSNAACAHITVQIRPVIEKIVPKTRPVDHRLFDTRKPYIGVMAQANNAEVSRTMDTFAPAPVPKSLPRRSNR